MTKNGIILTTPKKENCIFISHYLRLGNFWYETFQQTIQLWTVLSGISTAGFKMLKELGHHILLTIYTQNMLIWKKKHPLPEKD